MVSLRVAVSLCVASLSYLAAAISLEDIPKCSIPCVIQVMSNPAIANSSIEAMCAAKEMEKTIQDCISEKCTIRESLEFADFVSEVCNVPQEDDRPKYRAIVIAWTGISLAAVILLVVSKIFIATPWGLDDSFSVLTFCIIVPCTIFFLRATDDGFGSLRTLYQSDDFSPLLKNMFIWQILFIAGLACAKTSVLLFFLRIFPSQKFRRMVWTTLAFNTVATTILLVVQLTVGRIVELIWDHEDLAASMDKYKKPIIIILAHCVVDFCVDVWMLVLPMTQLYNLGLRTDKKIRVMCMFGIGIFLTVVSLVRLIIQAKVVPNPSETDGNLHSTVIWAVVELNVGFIVAVIAPIRQLFQLIAAAGKSREDSSTNRSRSRTATFVDRSLVRIKDVDEEQLVIHDVGNLCGTTLNTSSSRGTTKGHEHDDVELNQLGTISNGERQN
ncbi:hypothetical protein FPOAC2_06002 [Fusarium poae]